MSSLKTSIATFTLAASLGSAGLFADTVYLRSGAAVEGAVVRQNRNTLYLRTATGVRPISKDTIRRVVYGSSKQADEERKKREAAERARAAERERRVAEERRREENARIGREEAERRRAEEQRKQEEAQRKQREEDERKAEAERLKKAEEERKQAEAERKRAEEENRRAQAERTNKTEEDRKQAEAEKNRKAAVVTRRGDDSKNEKKTQEPQVVMRKKESEPRSTTAEISPLRALAYSAIFPGVGQWFSGRKSTAGTYAALGAGSLFLVYEGGRLYRNSLRDYEQLNNPFSQSGLISAGLGVSVVPSPQTLAEPAAQAAYSNVFEDQRAAVDRQYTNYRKAGLLFGTVYLINLADAYFGHPDQFGRGRVETDRLGAVTWSAAFPGLGQWKSGRRPEALLYGFLFSAAAFAAYDTRREYLNAKRVYENTGNPYSAETLTSSALMGRSAVPTPTELANPVTMMAYNLQFAEARSYMDRKYYAHRLALYSAVGLYLWAAADAWLFHPGAGGTGGGGGSMASGVEFEGLGVAVVPVAGNSPGRVSEQGVVTVDFRF